MILVDTSVLVDYLRAPSDRVLEFFQTREAAICGVIRAETLAGVRNVQDAAKVAKGLDLFTLVPTPETIWDLVGHNAAALRGSGITVPFTDVLIATLAIENGLPLWTKDRHFQRIGGVLNSLAFFTEPT
jgi:predicted nucleic acid-binding protein